MLRTHDCGWAATRDDSTTVARRRGVGKELLWTALSPVGCKVVTGDFDCTSCYSESRLKRDRRDREMLIDPDERCRVWGLRNENCSAREKMLVSVRVASIFAHTSGRR